MYILNLNKVTQCHCVAVNIQHFGCDNKNNTVPTYIPTYVCMVQLKNYIGIFALTFTASQAKCHDSHANVHENRGFVHDLRTSRNVEGTDSMSLLKYVFTKQVGVW